MNHNYRTLTRYLRTRHPSFSSIANKFEMSLKDQTSKTENSLTASLIKGDVNSAKRFCYLASKFYRYSPVYVDCLQSNAVKAALEADYKNQVSVVLLNADKISLNDALNVERALSGRNKSFSGAVSLIFFLCNLGRNDPTPYNLQGIKGRSNIYNLNSDELMAA